MASALAQAQIIGQQRLRGFAKQGASRLWADLPSYGGEIEDEWLSRVLPLVSSTQRASVALTNAYLARSLERQPLGVNVADLIGPALRRGTSMEEVYKRPLVTVWTALSQQKPWEEAVRQGLLRAEQTIATDVQLASRSTYGEIGREDDGIFGYERVANGGACSFCAEVDGAYVKDGDAMALHPECGCGLEPLTEPHERAAYLPSGVAVHEHGELGPVLADPKHDFTSEDDLH